MALLPAPGETNALYVVDLSGWARGVYEMGGPETIVRTCVGKLAALIADQQPAYLVFAVDPHDGRTWHHEVWPEYHATRTRPSEAYLTELGVFLGILAAHRIPALGAPGFAADDVIAAIVQQAKARFLRTVIVSRDQDLWQLLDEEGEIIAWDGKGRPTGAADVPAAYHGLGAPLLGDLLALAGDADEAPGVPGVGLKGAAKLLLRHGSLEEVLRKWQWEKGKLSANLRDHAELARLGRRLVTLRSDAPIVLDLKDAAVEWSEEDAAQIRELGQELDNKTLKSATWMRRIAPSQ